MFKKIAIFFFALSRTRSPLLVHPWPPFPNPPRAESSTQCCPLDAGLDLDARRVGGGRLLLVLAAAAPDADAEEDAAADEDGEDGHHDRRDEGAADEGAQLLEGGAAVGAVAVSLDALVRLQLLSRGDGSGALSDWGV